MADAITATNETRKVAFELVLPDATPEECIKIGDAFYRLRNPQFMNVGDVLLMVKSLGRFQDRLKASTEKDEDGKKKEPTLGDLLSTLSPDDAVALNEAMVNIRPMLLPDAPADVLGRFTATANFAMLGYLLENMPGFTGRPVETPLAGGEATS